MDRFTRFTGRGQAKGRQAAPVAGASPGVLDSVAFRAATERALAHGDRRALVLIDLDADDAVRAAAEAEDPAAAVGERVAALAEALRR